jgi:hypothetical protein
MASVGDIVSVENGTKWVVVGFFGNAHGGLDARLARKDSKADQSPGKIVTLLKDEIGVMVVQTPDFTEGERVEIQGMKGAFQRIEGINAVVLMDAYGWPMKADLKKEVVEPTKIQIDAGVSNVPLWQLVLENRDF